MKKKAALIVLGTLAMAAIPVLLRYNLTGRAERLPVAAAFATAGTQPQNRSGSGDYPFRPASASAPAVIEGGSVRFDYDRLQLRVTAEMTDSDLVQESDADNRLQYLSGDVLEIFIRPAGMQCYWEIHVTPNEKTSVFFYPSCGRRLPSCLQDKPLGGLTFRVELYGTLNKYQDRDKGWKCEVIIPFEALEKQCGQKLDFAIPWEIQVSRYNYSAYLDKAEYSQLGIATGKLDYHDFSSWALLTFE